MWQRFVKWFSPETRFKRAWHIGVTAIGLIVILVLAGDGLYSLFTNISQSSAIKAKAHLDATLVDASTRMHVPSGLIQPIRTQEQQVDTTTDGSLAGWQHANEEYARLQRQIDTIMSMSTTQARDMAQKDLTQFETSLATLAKGKYDEVTGYQGRLQQAQSSFQTASTTSDYFQIAGIAQDQIAAIASFEPTYKRLQDFSTMVASEQKLLQQITGSPQAAQLLCADGVGSTPEEYWTVYRGLMAHPVAKPGTSPVESQWLADDQALFHAAASAKDYDVLNQALDGQIAQVQATNAMLVPSTAAGYLTAFKADIQTLQDYQTNTQAIKDAFGRIHSLSSFPSLGISGWSVSAPSMRDLSKDIATFQTQYDQDAQLLSDQTFGDYSKAVQQIQKHRNGMKFDVIYAKTFLDIKTLIDLIAQGQAHTTLNNQKSGDNKQYPDAYEYIYQGTGIGDVINAQVTDIIGQGRLYNAHTTSDYQYLDIELQMFIHNITAMLKNLDDKTPYNQVHQTDTDLMQYYGIMQGRVMVVSLREQSARLYEDGKLIKGIYLTTGAPDLPSAPGINCTSHATTNQLMVSPDPPGSPNYYEPTPVKFGIYYHNYGLEIHDAWWRNQFGPLTNLPHYDPAAFNGGSHGCINISKEDMPWLFSWVNYGNIPVVVY
ncbi:MAG TPA: L,D-transpeptidase family protein [Ktedonobacterales bacterium]